MKHRMLPWLLATVTIAWTASVPALSQSNAPKAPDNPAALQTYLRQGFVVVGMAKRQLRLDGAYIDEILIEKWLQ